MTTKYAIAPDGRLAQVAAKFTPALSPDEIRSLAEPLTATEKRRKADVVDIDGILADPALRTSDRILRAAVGSLRALGYDIAWLSGVTGLTADELDPQRRAIFPVEHMQIVLTVAARIGDRPASPASTGLSAEQIEAVRRDARHHHCHAPACYDERYTYVVGSARELDRYADGSDSATVANKIRAVAHFMCKGGSGASVARMHGFDTRTWQRIVKQLGIRIARSGGGKATVICAAQGQDALRRASIDALYALDMGEDPMHVWTVLRLDAEMLAADPATEMDDDAEDVAA